MIHTSQKQGTNIVPSMEEPGVQCTVVFALMVTELASDYVYVWRRECYEYTPHPLACSVTIYAKTTVRCSPGSSMVPSHTVLKGPSGQIRSA
jgi:hypothetical protein